MNSRLFSLVQMLRAARDTLVAQGPVTLRQAADALKRLEGAFRQAADMIETVGPTVQFQASSQAQGDEVQKYMGELRQLKTDIEADISNISQAAPVDTTALPEGVQRGMIIDWIRNIDPETKKMILQMILGLITRIGV